MAPNASSDAMAAPTLPKLVTKAHAAEIFGVCVKSIDNYIAQGLLPRPVAFASREYWHPEVFEAFLAHTFKPSADAVHDAAPVEMALRGSPAPAHSISTPARPRGAESAASVRQRMRQHAKLSECNA